MKTILILIPVFNDWESADRLVSEIDLLHTEDCFSILFVDDASVKPVNISVPDKDFRRISDISVLSLNRNLGHQRAIASGLAYAYHNSDFKAVIVMDSDGEDRPDDIPALIKAFRESDRNKIIFAERIKRSESMQFKIFYQLYLITFRILTGFVDRMGNFSIVPRSLAKRLVTASEIWMHYSSSVRKLQIPYEKVMADRGLRYQGKSKMRLTGLIIHGLQAIAVHREIVAVRLFIFCLVSSLVLVSGMIAVVIIRLMTDLAIPGWATNLAGILTILLGQILSMGLYSILLVLGSRSAMEVVPTRDYKYFIDDCKQVYKNVRIHL
ncbi:MAG: glycosyltransferase [Desulfobacterales bacterium]|nr:glycosyltransferase [Desulfobacterales bacterium]